VKSYEERGNNESQINLVNVYFGKETAEQSQVKPPDDNIFVS